MGTEQPSGPLWIVQLLGIMKAAIILLLVGEAAAQRHGNRQFGGGGGGNRFGGGRNRPMAGHRNTGGGGDGFGDGFSSGAGGFPSGGGGFPSGAGGFGLNPCSHIARVYAGQRRDWGPKAYGLGLNNPCAIPPNPFLMQRAIALTQRVPNTLVRVDPNGEIELTDKFGKEAKVIDAFGRDLTDALEF